MNNDRQPDDSAAEIARLRRSLDELSIINDLARALSASFDLGTIMTTVIKRTSRAVNASQATITMVNSSSFAPDGTFVRDVDIESDPHFHLHQSIVGLMLHDTKPFTFNGQADANLLPGIVLQPGIRNLVCAPLMIGSQVIGVLTAYNKHGERGFDQDDKRLLSIIGAQSAQVIERARLLEDERSATQMREEIRMATAIQAGLLPSAPPVVPGYQIFGISEPARHVGGDYFDFIELDEALWGIALGDVSGKGVPASLLMANLQATLRGQALQGHDCTTCVTWCSRLLYRSTPPEKFATLFYCVLDPSSHRLCFCNAGHEPPLVFGVNGTMRDLGVGGVPAGVLDDFPYRGAETMLAVGELLVIYSDGVTDMVDGAEAGFGLDRLRTVVGALRTGSAEQVARGIVAAVHEHAGGEPPFDDLTVVVVKRT